MYIYIYIAYLGFPPSLPAVSRSRRSSGESEDRRERETTGSEENPGILYILLWYQLILLSSLLLLIEIYISFFSFTSRWRHGGTFRQPSAKNEDPQAYSGDHGQLTGTALTSQPWPFTLHLSKNILVSVVISEYCGFSSVTIISLTCNHICEPAKTLL